MQIRSTQQVEQATTSQTFAQRLSDSISTFLKDPSSQTNELFQLRVAQIKLRNLHRTMKHELQNQPHTEQVDIFTDNIEQQKARLAYTDHMARKEVSTALTETTQMIEETNNAIALAVQMRVVQQDNEQT